VGGAGSSKGNWGSRGKWGVEIEEAIHNGFDMQACWGMAWRLRCPLRCQERATKPCSGGGVGWAGLGVTILLQSKLWLQEGWAGEWEGGEAKRLCPCREATPVMLAGNVEATLDKPAG